MKMEVVMKPERRPAVIREVRREKVVRDGCLTYEERYGDEECVFVHTLASRESALCEHGDGTLSNVSWDHIRFLDSEDLFGEYAWE